MNRRSKKGRDSMPITRRKKTVSYDRHTPPTTWFSPWPWTGHRPSFHLCWYSCCRASYLMWGTRLDVVNTDNIVPFCMCIKHSIRESRLILGLNYRANRSIVANVVLSRRGTKIRSPLTTNSQLPRFQLSVDYRAVIPVGKKKGGLPCSSYLRQAM